MHQKQSKSGLCLDRKGEGRKPLTGVLPASVDPGGRDVDTRFGLVAAPFKSCAANP